jgi:hypothetical protein
VAIQIPAEESKLESLEPDVLKTRLASGHDIHFRAASDEGQSQDDFWKWFAAACAVCLLGEVLGLVVFRT